jgi:hypothetical protein
VKDSRFTAEILPSDRIPKDGTATVPKKAALLFIGEIYQSVLLSD